MSEILGIYMKTKLTSNYLNVLKYKLNVCSLPHYYRQTVLVKLFNWQSAPELVLDILHIKTSSCPLYTY